jgi:predicted nucleotidyltransferase
MIIYEDVLREFQKQKVKYIIVGGIAVNLLGALRNTADMDILVELSDKNLKKIIVILKKKGYRVKQRIDPIILADTAAREAFIKKKHMKACNFYKEGSLEEIDIIIDTPVSFEEAQRDALMMRSSHIAIPVISVAGLIKMKRRSGRPIDRLDIAELKQIEKIRTKL